MAKKKSFWLGLGTIVGAASLLVAGAVTPFYLKSELVNLANDNNLTVLQKYLNELNIDLGSEINNYLASEVQNTSTVTLKDKSGNALKLYDPAKPDYTQSTEVVSVELVGADDIQGVLFVKVVATDHKKSQSTIKALKGFKSFDQNKLFMDTKGTKSFKDVNELETYLNGIIAQENKAEAFKELVTSGYFQITKMPSEYSGQLDSFMFNYDEKGNAISLSLNMHLNTEIPNDQITEGKILHKGTIYLNSEEAGSPVYSTILLSSLLA